MDVLLLEARSSLLFYGYCIFYPLVYHSRPKPKHLIKLKGSKMEILKDFIVKQNEQGKLILNKGDWSLSSEEIRSGAVSLDGVSYLLIRFKD